MALDGAGHSSSFVQLDVAQFMDDASGFLAEDHRVFLVSSDLPEKISCMSLSSVCVELLCAGFRHSAGLHARVILDGATCRRSDLGDVRDVLNVLVVW